MIPTNGQSGFSDGMKALVCLRETSARICYFDPRTFRVIMFGKTEEALLISGLCIVKKTDSKSMKTKNLTVREKKI